MDIPTGTVFISRNLDESLNTSPGYWNHCAIYVGNNEIIEAQEGYGVIRTKLEIYTSRAYHFGLLYPRDRQVGIRAAEHANQLVGIRYRKISSIFKNPRKETRGLNCTSVIRTSYSYGLGIRDILLRIPDNLLQHPEVFTNKLSEVK